MSWFKKQSDDQELHDYFSQRLHRVRSEQIEGIFYWYDADTDQFITQGKTDDEIRSGLQQRWQEHIFVIGEHHMIMGPGFDQMIEFDQQPDRGETAS